MKKKQSYRLFFSYALQLESQLFILRFVFVVLVAASVPEVHQPEAGIKSTAQLSGSGRANRRLFTSTSPEFLFPYFQFCSLKLLPTLIKSLEITWRIHSYFFCLLLNQKVGSSVVTPKTFPGKLHCKSSDIEHAQKKQAVYGVRLLSEVTQITFNIRTWDCQILFLYVCAILKAMSSNICEYELDFYKYKFLSTNTTLSFWVRIET